MWRDKGGGRGASGGGKYQGWYWWIGGLAEEEGKRGMCGFDWYLTGVKHLTRYY